jgi:hypothetical protein
VQIRDRVANRNPARSCRARTISIPPGLWAIFRLRDRELDQPVSDALADWQVLGAALAVVQDAEVPVVIACVQKAAQFQTCLIMLIGSSEKTGVLTAPTSDGTL